MRVPQLIAATVVCCFAFLGARTVPDDSSDTKAVLHLEASLFAAWLKHDAATVDRLIADDYQSWSFKGSRRTKADLLRTVERNDETDTKVEEPVVRLFGDAAIYTARITDFGKHSGGDTYRATTCLTSVVIRRKGVWQVVATHETLLPETNKVSQ